MRTWRNWQTRKIQVLVSIWFMQVQVLLSAPQPIKTNRFFSVRFYIHCFDKRTCNNVTHCRQTLFAACIMQMTRLSLCEAIAITLVSLATSPVVRTRMNPVEPERFDWVFFFLIFLILDIHFISNGFLFKRKI